MFGVIQRNHSGEAMLIVARPIAVMICLAIGLGALTGCGPGSAPGYVFRTPPAPQPKPLPPRPAHFGVSLPVLDKDFDSDSLTMPPTLSADTVVPVIMRIDTMGVVLDYDLVRPGDTSIIVPCSVYLRTGVFVPGLVDSQSAEFRLPVLLSLRASGRPSVLVPVDSRHEITDIRLYWHSLALNGYRPPSLSSFPSYFCKIAPSDSVDRPPYVLARVSLDATGRPTDVDLIRSTEPAFTDQILSAMNWATYSPAERLGRPVPGSLLVSILLWPKITYPTQPFISDQRDDLSLFQRERIRTHPEMIGMMVPPVPRNFPKGNLTPRGVVRPLTTSATASILIDSTGHVIFRGAEGASRGMRLLRTVVEQLRYYPALDFEGKPQRFLGIVRLDFDDSRTVRIQSRWLDTYDFE
ncbi:MAG: hypothetical protein JSU65_06835 [Candidatus Zixiibacteriota bacterium]|nr:MAG: hypothetical protein JSU65_06835 [candidate division Zixibacteria bacterium]